MSTPTSSSVPRIIGRSTLLPSNVSRAPVSFGTACVVIPFPPTSLRLGARPHGRLRVPAQGSFAAGQHATARREIQSVAAPEFHAGCGPFTGTLPWSGAIGGSITAWMRNAMLKKRLAQADGCPSCGRVAVATVTGQCVHCLQVLEHRSSHVDPAQILKLADYERTRERVRNAGGRRQLRVLAALVV